MEHEWSHKEETGQGIKPVEEPMKLTFMLKQHKPAGQLTVNDDGKLEFEGDVEESAKIFFDYLCANFTIPAKKE